MRTTDNRGWILVSALLVAVVLAAGMMWWKQRSDAESRSARASSRFDREVLTQIHASRELFAGRVVDAETQRTIPRFKISLKPWALPDAAADSSSQSRIIGPLPAASPRFRLQGLPKGEWRLIVQAPNYEPFEARLLIGDDEPSANVVLPLHRGRSITGRVYSESDGEGIRGATLVFRDDRPERRGSHWRTKPTTRTLGDGYFTSDNLPVGPLKIDVQADGFASRQIDLPALGDPAQPLEISLSSTAR